MSTPSALVAYGSKHGSTAEIAEWIGGVLYANRWHRAARRFARRHAGALRRRPVWLFSSGPLDHSADERDIAPVRGVARIAARLQARGHATFGGRLSAEPPGLIARSMAKKFAGDFRNAEQVRMWAKAIAGGLPYQETTSGGAISRKEP